jgi:hypothetical protein
MQRCVVAPKTHDSEAVLKIASHLILQALARKDGGVIAFLPGWDEIQTVQNAVLLESRELEILILHSDTIGDEDEARLSLQIHGEKNPVILSTVIGARTITYPNLKHCIIHPACRSQSLHPSGIKRLLDELLPGELEGNMSGRVARVGSGMVTYMYNVDDSFRALRVLEQRQQAASSASGHAHADILNVVFGPASRFYYVQHTCQHLTSRGFQNVYWLRTPEAHDLDAIDTDSKKRVMMVWYTTVLPVLHKMQQLFDVQRACVFEDTCILAPDVHFDDVCNATSDYSGSLFGYGLHEMRDGELNSFGTKALCITKEWWQRLAVILENTELKDFVHHDYHFFKHSHAQIKLLFQTKDSLNQCVF